MGGEGEERRWVTETGTGKGEKKKEAKIRMLPKRNPKPKNPGPSKPKRRDNNTPLNYIYRNAKRLNSLRQNTRCEVEAGEKGEDRQTNKP